jgi:glycopeptide antibiotics resistance protein
MTAETDGAGPGTAAPVRITWGRAVLRVIIPVGAFIALVGFAMVLAELTLTPSRASAEIAGTNLRPGHSLRQYLLDYTFLAACKQIGGNLLMGAPFGLILPVLVPRRLKMLRVVMLTASVMVLVELAQGAIIEGRAFDVDDVILNTSGALIAYLWLGRRIGRRFHALSVPVPVTGARDDTPTGSDALDKPAVGTRRARWAGSVRRAVTRRKGTVPAAEPVAEPPSLARRFGNRLTRTRRER